MTTHREPPAEEEVDPSESFRRSGGDATRLRGGLKSQRGDADAEALAKLDRPSRIRVLAGAGYNADHAADLSSDLEQVFGLNQRSPMRWSKLPGGIATTAGGMGLLAGEIGGGISDFALGGLKSAGDIIQEAGAGIAGGFSPTGPRSRGKRASIKAQARMQLPTPADVLRRGQESPGYQRIIAGVAVGAFIPATPIEQAAGRLAGAALKAPIVGGRNLIRATTSDIRTMGLGDDLFRQIDGIRAPSGAAGAQTVNATPTATALFGIKAITVGLTKGEEVWNMARRTVNRAAGLKPLRLDPPAVLDDPVSTPVINLRREAVPRIASRANTQGQEAEARFRGTFDLDDTGAIKNMPEVHGIKGAPDIADVAARLPLYLEHLTPSQKELMTWLRETFEPYGKALKEVGDDFGQRPDIMDGGFYLPRGNAMQEGFDAPARLSHRRAPGGGGRPGEEKGAEFGSVAEGRAAGWEYSLLGARLSGFVEHTGNRVLNKHIANYLETVIDPSTGKLAGQTAADRVSDALRRETERVRNQFRARRLTLLRQQTRTGAIGKEDARALRREGAAEEAFGTAEARMSAEADALDDIRTRPSVEGSYDARDIADETRKAIQMGRDLAYEMGRNLELKIRAGGALSTTERELQRRVDKLWEGVKIIDRTGKPFTLRQMERVQREIDRLSPEASRLADEVESLADAGKVYKGLAKEEHEVLLRANRKERFMVERDRYMFGVEREARALERALVQAQHAADASGNRTINAVQRELQTQTDLDAIGDQKRDIERLWREAQERAQGTPPGMDKIDLPGMQSYDFATTIANAANKALREEGAPRGFASGATQTIRTANSIWRGMKATADNSWIGIQGLLSFADLGVGATPGAKKAVKDALAVNFRAWGIGKNGDLALGQFTHGFNQRAALDGVPTAARWASGGGLHQGAGRAEELIISGKGLSGKIGGLPFFKQSNRAFGYIGDTMRLTHADTLFREEMRRSGRTAQQIMDSPDFERIARIVNRMTGYAETRFGGDLGEMALFAPRYFQSRLATLARAVTPSNAIESRVARRSMLKLAGTAVALTYMANELRGEETDWWPVDDKGNWNPNFMRIRNLNGRDWSLFGPWDSLLRQIYMTASGKPIQAASGLVSGPVQIGVDFFRNEDFQGNYVRESWGDVAAYALRQMLPFSGEKAAQGVQATIKDPTKTPQNILTLLVDVMGAKSAPPSGTDELDKYVRGLGITATGVRSADGLPPVQKWSELNDGAKGQLKQEIAVQDILDRHEREADPDIQRHMKEKATGQQVVRDTRLQAGEMSGGEWKDDMFDAARESAGAREALRQVNKYPDKRPDDPNKRGVWDYYKLQNSFTDEASGGFNSQEWQVARESYLTSLTDDQRKWLLTSLHPNATPVVRDYYKMQDEKKAANWDEMYLTYPSMLNDVGDRQRVMAEWRGYLAAQRGGKDALLAWNQAHPELLLEGGFISKLKQRMEIARDFYRAQNPAFDRLYTLFNDSAGQSPSAQAREAEIRYPSMPIKALRLGGSRIGDAEVAALQLAGITTLEQVAQSSAARLSGLRGISVASARSLIEQATAILKEQGK